MSQEVLDTIKGQIEDNPILLYMKGSPQAPQCGFSAQTVQCLMACGERFAYVDILSNPAIRATLPQYANWPTFPQLYVEGRVGGWLRHRDRDVSVRRTRTPRQGGGGKGAGRLLNEAPRGAQGRPAGSPEAPGTPPGASVASHALTMPQKSRAVVSAS